MHMIPIIFSFVALTLWYSPALAVDAPVKVSDLDDKSFLVTTKGKQADSSNISVPKATKIGIQVVYSPTQNPVLNKIRERYMKAQVWERVFEPVNDVLKFKNPTTFQMAECGTPGAFWYPAQWRMVMCYEMVLNAKFGFEANGVSKQDIDAKVHGAIIGIAWHEFGHFINSEFDLPVVGNTEDAADQISTLVLIAQNSDSVSMAKAHAEMQAHVESDAYMKAAAALLGAVPKAMQTLKAHMIRHSGGKKRRHNTLCLIYGSDPTRYANLVGGDGLHPMRAARCEEEFQSVSRAWTKLLMPHSHAPQDIIRKRCTTATKKLLAFMGAEGAPAGAIKKAMAAQEKTIAQCTADYLKDQRATQKRIQCVRFAKSFREARACKQ
jgi:hypothetical protein